MPKAIPDRWMEYENMGRQIDGTRFMAFKVPLKTRSVPDDMAFTPQTLLDACSDLGLVIDLTNTDRYYDKEAFISNGVKYKKIFTKGHVVPSKTVVQSFFSTVEAFLRENKDNGKLIGVHCTHGVNRTGYLICRFMIERLGIPSDQAISDFNTGRGHRLERENYLDDLYWLDASSNASGLQARKPASSFQSNRGGYRTRGNIVHNSSRNSYDYNKPRNKYNWGKNTIRDQNAGSSFRTSRNVCDGASAWTPNRDNCMDFSYSESFGSRKSSSKFSKSYAQKRTFYSRKYGENQVYYPNSSYNTIKKNYKKGNFRSSNYVKSTQEFNRGQISRQYDPNMNNIGKDRSYAGNKATTLNYKSNQYIWSNSSKMLTDWRYSNKHCDNTDNNHMDNSHYYY